MIGNLKVVAFVCWALSVMLWGGLLALNALLVRMSIAGTNYFGTWFGAGMFAVVFTAMFAFACAKTGIFPVNGRKNPKP